MCYNLCFFTKNVCAIQYSFSIQGLKCYCLSRMVKMYWNVERKGYLEEFGGLNICVFGKSILNGSSYHLTMIVERQRKQECHSNI